MSGVFLWSYPPQKSVYVYSKNYSIHFFLLLLLFCILYSGTFKIYSAIRLSSHNCVINSVFSVFMISDCTWYCYYFSIFENGMTWHADIFPYLGKPFNSLYLVSATTGILYWNGSISSFFCQHGCKLGLVCYLPFLWLFVSYCMYLQFLGQVAL